VVVAWLKWKGYVTLLFFQKNLAPKATKETYSQPKSINVYHSFNKKMPLANVVTIVITIVHKN
jgi:hypothetical protein